MPYMMSNNYSDHVTFITCICADWSVLPTMLTYIYIPWLIPLRFLLPVNWSTKCLTYSIWHWPHHAWLIFAVSSWNALSFILKKCWKSTPTSRRIQLYISHGVRRIRRKRHLYAPACLHVTRSFAFSNSQLSLVKFSIFFQKMQISWKCLQNVIMPYWDPNLTGFYRHLEVK